STTERNKAIGQFLAKGKADMDYLASQPCDQLQTNLYRSIIHLVGQLDQQAIQKRIWIFSDLCESSSAFESSRYSKNPARIMKDYDTIKAALEADAPLPDMTGIEFILVTPGNTDLLLWMSRFWEKLLNSKGAHVKVRGSF
ncbi:MAG: hypothetical protein MI862_09725, partial [Desulfobacterales bacterium]|nr:hypothetical protein [Desulfobacterales bacterium]